MTHRTQPIEISMMSERTILAALAARPNGAAEIAAKPALKTPISAGLLA